MPMMCGCRHAWPVALMLLALVLAGCSPGRPEPTAAELAQQAAAAVDRLNSLHFVLTIAGGPAFLDPQRTLNLRQAEGDVVRPDRARTAARVAVTGFVVNVTFINIGSTGYMTDPLSGRWGPLPPALTYNPALLFDPKLGVGGLIRQMEGLARAGDEQIDGVDSYHLTGELPAAALVALTGGVLPGERVKAELWVAKEGAVLRQVRLTEIGTANPKGPMTWTLTLSRHDQPVTIEPPA